MLLVPAPGGGFKFWGLLFAAPAALLIGACACPGGWFVVAPGIPVDGVVGVLASVDC